MGYVVTFEHWDGECESFTVNGSCIELAIMEAKEKANDKHNHSGYDFYSDDNILSIVRV